MRYNSLIDDKKKAKVKEAIAKGDPSLIFPKKKLEQEPEKIKKPRELSPGEQALNNKLIQAIKDKNIVLVKEALANGADANAQSDGWPVLHILSGTYKTGHFDIVDLLLSEGADINAKGGPLGRTMLIIAAESGSYELVKMLISKGADLEIKDDDTGGTALMWAIKTGDDSKIRLLIEKGADVNTRNRYGRTPLIHLAYNCPESFAGKAEILLSSGADVDAADIKGATALMRIAWGGKLKGVELLVSYRADVNKADNSGDTALSYAKTNGHTDIEGFLRGNGAVI